MASINTNAAAMTALQTLTATNKNLGTTQNRISTGLRVDTAADNAAYWSIATTMRSDNKSMSSVQDALGFGAAQVDVAYTAMDAVKDTLDNMKAKLVAAQQPDIDKAKIQEEIKQLQNDLKTYAESASFSGGNWLNVNGSGEQRVVASFMRDADNNISIGTIDIDTSKTALFNSAAGETGLLEQQILMPRSVDVSGLEGESTTTGVAGTNAEATITGVGDLSLQTGDELVFSFVGNNGNTQTVTATYDADADEFTYAGQGTFTIAFDGDDITITGDDTAGDIVVGSNFTVNATPVEPDPNADPITVANLDISSATAEELTAYMQAVDSALMSVTTAASDLGAIKTRIDSQQNFVGKIMDAIDRGVGQLVDADMQEESARLSALQVQQQLGIQSLSIANSNAQNILSLFR